MATFISNKKVFFVSVLLSSTSAFSFGPADILGTVFDVGSKVGGALIDKAIDATKDPEVERQKKLKAQDDQDRAQIEAFKKAQADIESHKDWTPLQREKAKLKLISVYSQVKSMTNFLQTMQDKQEAARKAENDRLLSVGGIASTVASSAMNSTSVQIARADAMVSAGIPQTQSKDALSQIDNKGNLTTSGQINRTATAVAGAQIFEESAAGRSSSGIGQLSSAPKEMLDAAKDAKLSAETSVDTIANQGTAKSITSDFFEIDRGKKIYLEFIDSDHLSQFVREELSRQGHQMVENRSSADIYYRIEGEFEIPENSMHLGVRESVGKMYEHVSKVELPEAKVKGSVSTFFVKSLMAIVPSKDPNGTKPEVKLMMDQTSLIVASREAANEPEVRRSTQKTEKNNSLQADTVVASALDMLFTKLGLPSPPNSIAAPGGTPN